MANEYISEPVDYELSLDDLKYEPCKEAKSNQTLLDLASTIRLPEIKISKGKDVAETILNLLMNEPIRSGAIILMQNSRSYLMKRIEYYTKRNAQIELILTEVPFKVCNGLKVITHKLPDLAELYSLLWLARIVDAISEIYPPGAKLTLIAEGRLIAEALYYDPEDANSYTEANKELIRVLGLSNKIEIVDLYHLFRQIGVDYSKLYVNLLIDILQKYENDEATKQVIEKILPQMRKSINSNRVNPEELERISLRMSLNYYALLKVIDKAELHSKLYPNHVRCTLSPKENRININIGAEIWPHHGVGVLNEDYTVTVKYEIDVLRSGNYEAVYIKGYDYPYYYQRVGSSARESIRLKKPFLRRNACERRLSELEGSRVQIPPNP